MYQFLRMVKILLFYVLFIIIIIFRLWANITFLQQWFLFGLFYLLLSVLNSYFKPSVFQFQLIYLFFI